MKLFSAARQRLANLRDPEDRLRELLVPLQEFHGKLHLYNQRITASPECTLESVVPIFTVIVAWHTEHYHALKDLYESLKQHRHKKFKIPSILKHVDCFMGIKHAGSNCLIAYTGGLFTKKGILTSAITCTIADGQAPVPFERILLLPETQEDRVRVHAIAHTYLREHLTAICCAITEIELHFQNASQQNDTEWES